MPELPSTTESEQMYLITVARTTEEGASGPVPIATLASSLAVSVASVNEMVRKLAGRGLVEYVPYKGVELTEAGQRIAGRVLRTRRLWATFLAQHLGFSAEEADALACHFEHVTPADAVERLAAYLGDPHAGPLGKPIPPGAGTVPRFETATLADIPVGETAEMLSTSIIGRAREYLTAESLTPGAIVTMHAAGSSGVLLEVAGHWIHLAPEIASSIEVARGVRHAPA